ncbi:ABC transporter substrate-binding protein [Limimaricola soesokkakensis]|uniref:ABC transporter substrate-binding protein n=1 Tax=Limimaricola soesokkakensis TaxID=1343159 RepID=UPI003511006B
MKTAFTTLFAAGLAAAPVLAQDTEIEIGYMPILPVSQLFVALENGALDEAGIDADLVEFQNGPAMVQALLAGQLDVAYLGIGPAMVARGRGADIKVVASNIVEQISLVALPPLAADFEGADAATAFAAFAAREGRKPVISTFPTGSVPETVLQYWMREEAGIDPDLIEIIHQGTAQVQQALLTGAVDGAAILEPVVSTTLARVEGAEVVAAGAEMFPDQPGAVLVVREGLLERSPETVEALVAAHIVATDLLASDAATAAPMVAKHVGGGRLDPAVVEAAISRSSAQFVADPNRITEGTRAMHDFQLELGTLAQPVDLDALFDLDVFERAAAR